MTVTLLFLYCLSIIFLLTFVFLSASMEIKEILDENEGDIGKSIKLLYQLSENINKALAKVDQSKIFKSNNFGIK